MYHFALCLFSFFFAFSVSSGGLVKRSGSPRCVMLRNGNCSLFPTFLSFFAFTFFWGPTRLLLFFFIGRGYTFALTCWPCQLLLNIKGNKKPPIRDVEAILTSCCVVTHSLSQKMFSFSVLRQICRAKGTKIEKDAAVLRTVLPHLYRVHESCAYTNSLVLKSAKNKAKSDFPLFFFITVAPKKNNFLLSCCENTLWRFSTLFVGCICF